MYNDANEQTNGEMFLYKFIEPQCKVIFDVGVWDTVYYLTNPNIVYHLFEPGEIFSSLQQKTKNMPNIIANNFGLGNKKGTKKLHSVFASFIDRDKTDRPGPVVSVDTLDNYVENYHIDHIDFLKIDIEGWEFPIIQGAVKSLDKIDNIQWEYGGTWRDGGFKISEMFSLLKDKGFYLYIIDSRNIVEIKEKNWADHYSYCNYFATRNPEKFKSISH